MSSCNCRLLIVVLVLIVVPSLSFAVYGCGAGAGVGAVTSNLMGGFAVKGPVVNGIVKAYILLPTGEKGDLLASGTTDQNGAFQLTIEDYEGPVWIEVVAGTFKDEATGLDACAAT